MQVLPAKAKDEKKVTQEGIQEVNQNVECLVNLCKLNILETQLNYLITRNKRRDVFSAPQVSAFTNQRGPVM